MIFLTVGGTLLFFYFHYGLVQNRFFFNARINISVPEKWNFPSACGGSFVSNFDKLRTTFYVVHGFKSSYGYMYTRLYHGSIQR